MLVSQLTGVVDVPRMRHGHSVSTTAARTVAARTAIAAGAIAPAVGASSAAEYGVHAKVQGRHRRGRRRSRCRRLRFMIPVIHGRGSVH